VMNCICSRVSFFFSSRSRHTRFSRDWSSDVCSSDLQYMNQHFGKYPYDVYSIIQGGDGGMEYPMCTLITGERSMGSLIGVTAHRSEERRVGKECRCWWTGYR